LFSNRSHHWWFLNPSTRHLVADRNKFVIPRKVMLAFLTRVSDSHPYRKHRPPA
jgi:hypothetical protein